MKYLIAAAALIAASYIVSMIAIELVLIYL